MTVRPVPVLPQHHRPFRTEEIEDLLHQLAENCADYRDPRKLTFPIGKIEFVRLMSTLINGFNK